MNTLSLEHETLVNKISFSADAFTVHLNDSRHMTIPLAWYPRLLAGKKQEREKYELIGNGEGIHWPALDEDILLDGLLSGRPSQENQSSLRKWLLKRQGK